MTAEGQAQPLARGELRGLLIVFAGKHNIHVDFMVQRQNVEGFVVDQFIEEVIVIAAVKRTAEVQYFGPKRDLLQKLYENPEAASEILRAMRCAFLRRGAEFRVYKHEEPERWELRVLPIWRRWRQILRAACAWLGRSFTAAIHPLRRSR